MVFGIDVPYFSGREKEYFGINVVPGGRRCEDLAPMVDEVFGSGSPKIDLFTDHLRYY